MRVVGDVERRQRLARRHALAPGHRAADALAATRAMTVLHATEAPSVYLSLWARVDGITVEDVDRALYDERSLVKQLAMRRTLFVFPRDLLPAAWGSASARVATALRTRFAKEIEQGGIAPDGAAWLAAAESATVARLADGAELSAQQLREEVPELAGRLDVGKDKYATTVSVAPPRADPAGRGGEDRARPQRRTLAHRPAAVDRDGVLAGHGGAEPARARQGA